MPTSFTLDPEIQRQAMAKATADGLSSLSSAIRLLLAGYVSGRITIAAVPVSDAVTIEKVEEIPLSASDKKLARRIFAAVRRHG